MATDVGVSKRYTVWGWTGTIWKQFDALSVKLIQSINNPTQADVILLCDPSADDRVTLARGGRLAVSCGTRLLDKLYIDDSDFKIDKTVSLVAYSSGGKFSSKRSLLKETVGEDAYIDLAGSSLVSSLVDSTNILAIDGTDNGGTGKANFDTRYEKRIECLSKLCEKLGKEWWVEYPSLDNTPAAEGTDTLHVANTKGTAGASQFTLRTSGDSANAHYVSNKNTDVDRVNHCVIVGTGSKFRVNSMKVEHYLASTKQTNLSSALDTYANEDIDVTETTITVKDATVLPATGRILIDSEQIDYTGKTGDDLTGCTRGANSTEATYHSTGAEVLNMGTNGTNVIVPVDSVTGFPASGTLRVGAEVVTYTGVSGSTFTGGTRGCNDHDAVASEKYTHGDNCPVYLYKSGANWYHPTSPEASSTIATEGIIAKSFTDNQSKYFDDLDKKVNYLLNYYSTVKNIEVQIADPFYFLDDSDIQTGDLVTIIDTATDLNTTYRIKELIHSLKYGMVDLTAVLSTERKLFSLGLKDGISMDITAPSSKLQDRIGEWASFQGTTLDINTGAHAQYTNIGGQVRVLNGKELRVYSTGNTEKLRMYHDGSKAVITVGSASGNIELSTVAGYINLNDDVTITGALNMDGGNITSATAHNIGTAGQSTFYGDGSNLTGVGGSSFSSGTNDLSDITHYASGSHIGSNAWHTAIDTGSAIKLLGGIVQGYFQTVEFTIDGAAPVTLTNEVKFEDTNDDDIYMVTIPPIDCSSSLKIRVQTAHASVATAWYFWTKP